MIHYHGTPLSGKLETRRVLAGRHACVSFARPDDLEVAAEICQSFVLDNGAFSLWRIGAPYDSDAYVRWAEHWLLHPGCDWALIPDVIDGGESENDSRLTLVPPKSPRWVPVWHLHESLERLERLAHEWPRVAMGSSGEFAVVGDAAWWGRMAAAMETVCDDEGRPICKLHGLRMLDPSVFSALPLASADSTNVARNMGHDARWHGPYVPRSVATRALVLMDRIEAHASARRWTACGVERNWDLFG